jgi:hypothetical protein
MNTWLAAASVLTSLVAIGHSVIGEWVIFRGLRTSGVVPTQVPGLRAFEVRILWASWHVVTLLGLLLAWLMWGWAAPQPAVLASTHALPAIALTFTASAVLVAYATRGRHPAWIALLLVAALTVLA